MKKIILYLLLVGGVMFNAYSNFELKKVVASKYGEIAKTSVSDSTLNNNDFNVYSNFDIKKDTISKCHRVMRASVADSISHKIYKTDTIR